MTRPAWGGPSAGPRSGTAGDGLAGFWLEEALREVGRFRDKVLSLAQDQQTQDAYLQLAELCETQLREAIAVGEAPRPAV